MRRSLPTLLAFACAAALTGQAFAATPGRTELTLYRSDDSSLFSADNNGAIASGFALAREPRTLDLQSGTQEISLHGLPQFLDTEGLSLSIDGGKLLSQQLRLDQSQSAMLSGMIGKRVSLRGNGQATPDGILVATENGGLLIRADDNRIYWTPATGYNYASVRGEDYAASGAILNLKVQASRSGKTQALLSYPTSGLGWRASYIGTLQPGAACRMQWESRASIANRSGRDWNDVKLSLIAGEPNLEKASAPRPMMMAKAGMVAAPAAMDAMPRQSSLEDYRQYTLPQAVDLPNGSVTQTPLYDERSVDCERTALYENGNWGMPAQPIFAPGYDAAVNNQITNTMMFKAFDSLPAGYLRVLANDRDGTPQYVGETRIADTAKGQNVTVTLGNAFDLTPKRERTAFSVDQADRHMDAAFKITLSNAGDAPRVVTVREHPNRWHEWQLTSSSIKPSKQTPDTLDFKVSVPANGTATLEYAVRCRGAPDVTPR